MVLFAPHDHDLLVGRRRNTRHTMLLVDDAVDTVRVLPDKRRRHVGRIHCPVRRFIDCPDTILEQNRDERPADPRNISVRERNLALYAKVIVQRVCMVDAKRDQAWVVSSELGVERKSRPGQNALLDRGSDFGLVCFVRAVQRGPVRNDVVFSTFCSFVPTSRSWQMIIFELENGVSSSPRPDPGRACVDSSCVRRAGEEERDQPGECGVAVGLVAASCEKRRARGFYVILIFCPEPVLASDRFLFSQGTKYNGMRFAPALSSFAMFIARGQKTSKYRLFTSVT
jgi:hypothetical protein